MDRMKDRLDALWVEYRGATPDPEAGPNFMPQLWQKIEARRVETTSVFRRLAQICVMATIALALVISAVLIPLADNYEEVFYSGTYVDILAAEHSNDYVEALPAGIIDELLSQEHRTLRGPGLRERSRARCFRRSSVQRDAR